MTAVIRPTDEATGAAEIPATSISGSFSAGPGVPAGIKVEGAPAGTSPALLSWVLEVAELTRPDRVVFTDGSDQEWDRLIEHMLGTGTITKLAAKENSYWAASDPTDVARVEDRTYICSVDPADAGATNNWMDPTAMKSIMTALYEGCMTGRTMYVMPFCMGPYDAPNPKLGVEITDSEYVVASMRIMTRMGTKALELINAGNPWVKALHSIGAPLAPGQQDVPWPCNDTKYIVQFPEERTIWSFGSGYGGNALLGKKCYSLRIASVMARDEGWLAEHMLILKITSPAGKVDYLAAAFPSACGKTNLAMLEPTIPGWKVETLGDDIAWMTFGEDGRLYAVNPEYGLFGVAPGTGWNTNPNAMRTIAQGNSLFTNVALTDDGDIWWEGLTEEPPAHLTDWKGRDWTPSGLDEHGRRLDSAGEPSSHPNSRFCTPITQCPIIADEYFEPVGVPISAILFGGRRKTTIPLVTQSRDWQHGVFMGATLSSETTAAATGAVGVVRRDPMAMLPFIGYNAGDYFAHWIDMGKGADESKLPKIFYVNWFRRDADGGFLWPGFGENSRVLKWVIERLDGSAAAVETPIGHVPGEGSLDVDGLGLTADELAAALTVDREEWAAEIPLIEEWFAKIGDSVPTSLRDELDSLKLRLGLS
ncbi:Phosphoenolpyruvate carboxykinase (GTP) [Nakamurella multipartita DSM 44233]|uniref:Phosphoenolpyruvate carboxykinase [GTP] n=1 Tax=Nakamurella multipartita (strain ATCC 700099 / DSM 44233 / CIP 104796 / JCM 9543 / NBRC 105858 / Y-104) TaxID=479431 RepID=C8XD90_NAKMY|nr:phosphoenolpyruvate carboxykinase (GTP) [Nakamurella multipartita]ACV81580.1 Phosphoenolpyruvate carboxykinase (GTP) [Nakamurella multipartita DSM 44233]